MKKPGETLSQYVRRRLAEEGPMTDAEIDAHFIDGNRLHEEGAAVLMTSGTGEGEAADKARVVDTKPVMPITERAGDDQGAGFVIGMGGNTPKRQAGPKRSPSTTPSSGTRRRGGTKST